MKNIRLKSTLDKTVMVLSITSLIIPLLLMLVQSIDPNGDIFLLQAIYNSKLLTTLTFIYGISLLSWVAIGEGLNSKLWKWLPPFVFFKNFGSLGKIILVLVLCVAVFTGAVSDLRTPTN